jgi:hypothetical protein
MLGWAPALPCGVTAGGTLFPGSFFRKTPGRRGRSHQGVGKCPIEKMQLKETTRRFLAWALLVGTVGIALSTREQLTAKIPKCQHNLEHIMVFKLNWEGGDGITSKSIPTWDDLRPFFPTAWSNCFPLCPAGGTYSLGRVGQNPTCSIGGKGHGLLVLKPARR